MLLTDPKSKWGLKFEFQMVWEDAYALMLGKGGEENNGDGRHFGIREWYGWLEVAFRDKSSLLPIFWIIFFFLKSKQTQSPLFLEPCNQDLFFFFLFMLPCEEEECSSQKKIIIMYAFSDTNGKPRLF